MMQNLDWHSEEIQLAMWQAGKYYKSLTVKSVVIFSHRVKQPQLKQVLCYNYIAEETWKVLLEPTLYHFTLGYHFDSGKHKAGVKNHKPYEKEEGQDGEEKIKENEEDVFA